MATNTFSSLTAASWLIACLALSLLGMPGCGSSSEEVQSSTAVPVEQQASTLTVDMDEIDGEGLLSDFAADEDFSDYSRLVSDIQLVVDHGARHVDLVIHATSADVAQLCATGQAVAQCLSDHARVTDSSGAELSDEEPCGALFAAYGLSVRVEGLGSADVFDGMLPAGGDEVMWQ